MNHVQANDPPIDAGNMAAYQYALLNCMNGVELEERGAKYRTWDAAMVHFDSNQPILFNFADRKLNAKYAVEEFLWYVRGNKHDDTIEQHATAWKKLKQEDGSFFSNYGHYIFRKMTPDGISAFRFAFEQLVRNVGSRRAAIPLLETKHCFHDNSDMVCTWGIQFFVRNNYLNMIVNMRSNDAVWGLTNDAFAFCMLHRLMYVALRSSYPTLRLGAYTHIANTLHVYERHYEMAQRVIDADLRGVPLITVPMFSAQDAIEMLNNRTEELQWTKFLDSLPS
jgi:thymidylate synthase